MSGQWKPGDVGSIDSRGDDARVMRVRSASGLLTSWVAASGERLNPYLVPRPLVVIDPEDREQVERLLASLQGMSFSTWACGAFTCLQGALRDLADPTPPKPEEPTGLGAVVRDIEGRRWTRYDTKGDRQPWWCDGAGPEVLIERRFPYADIAAAEVLSEGVTP